MSDPMRVKRLTATPTHNTNIGQDGARRLWHRRIPASLLGPSFLATRSLGGLRKQSPILPRQDIATTVGSPTATREVLIVGRMIRIAVIVRQLFPVSDIAKGDQPERAGRLCDFTVRITGVVAIARRISEDCAINII